MQTAVQKLISKDYTGIISLEEAKGHLRIPVDLTEQDALITSCIFAAIGTAEARTEHIYSATVFQFRVNPTAATIILPHPDFNEVTKVEALDTAGTATTLFQKGTSPDPDTGTLADYILVDDWTVPAELTILEDAIPTGTKYLVITLSFQSTEIPKHVLQGMLMMLSHFYDNPREVEVGRTANQVPMGADTLFGMERFYRL